MTVRGMRIVWWIPEATNAHTEYVIIIACPLQQWLNERITMLRVTYITCHFKYPDCTIQIVLSRLLQKAADFSCGVFGYSG